MTLWGRCASCLFGIKCETSHCPGCGSARVVAFGAPVAEEAFCVPPEPAVPAPDGWVKFPVSLYPDEAAAIEELARKKRCSKADAVRRAVRAYFWGRDDGDRSRAVSVRGGGPASPKDYEYRAADLSTWLAGAGAENVTVRSAFGAGERYGADLERGSLFRSLDEYEGEALEAGWSLADYLRYRLVDEQDRELPVEPPPAVRGEVGR